MAFGLQGGTGFIRTTLKGGQSGEVGRQMIRRQKPFHHDASIVISRTAFQVNGYGYIVLVPTNNEIIKEEPHEEPRKETA
jgi:hypothetical protein